MNNGIFDPHFSSKNTAEQGELLEQGREEEALRAALDRLGSKKTSPKSNENRNTPQTFQQPSSRLTLGRTTQDAGQVRKRRFVRDGDVQVEHHTFERTKTPRPQALSEAGDGDATRRNHALEAERRLREQAERQVQELEMQLRSLETRLGHAEILVTELKQTVTTRDEELTERTKTLSATETALTAAQEEIRNLKRKASEIQPKDQESAPAKRATRRASYELADAASGEPQPVKWWKD